MRRPLLPPGIPVRRILLAAALVTSGLPASADAQERTGRRTNEAAARLRGQALDLFTGRPVSDVGVRILSLAEGATPVNRITDEAGRFFFADLTPGLYLVDFQHIGFGTVGDTIQLTQGADVSEVAEMAPAALELPGVMVSVTRRSRLDTAGFYDRRRTRAGHFIAREDFEHRFPFRFSDLLRMVPSLRLSYPSGGQGAVITGRGGCYPTYYLDGVRMLESSSLDNFVLPDHVEGIEVYTSATVPAEYAGGRCGTVVIWSRQPGAPGGGRTTWRRVLIGTLAATTLILIGR